MGPFYCPGDQKVYIDLGFFETMKHAPGRAGDFAQAYVIAHEVGHHVQKLLGITDKVDAMRQRSSPAQIERAVGAAGAAGRLLRRRVGASRAAARQILEQGDIEEALNAASQIGDDTLQRKSQGTVVPESFTHGTSAQRVGWFKRGLSGGNVRECNTFDNTRL